MTKRWIYFFGNHEADGSGDSKHLIGGKGASLADMTRAGLNVPPGFTISTECCAYFYQHEQRWPDDLEAELRANLARLEKLAGRPFGAGAAPLLVAVRSGAAVSMPGMMDTVLNVGLNPACVAAMAERTGNPRGAWEAYLHFIWMYAHTVAGIDLSESDRQRENVDALDAVELESLCRRLRDLYAVKMRHEFPTDPWGMLGAAVNAVFRSWHSERAVAYRKHHHVDDLLGTAVNVQMMCPSEVSGVLFTSNPVNAAAEIIIESAYGLGEAIVLGKVTPDRFVLDRPTLKLRETVIAHKAMRVATLAEDGAGQAGGKDDASLSLGQVETLAQLGKRVEEYFQVPCDIEWGLARGEFYLLQARPIKFKAAAAGIDPAERAKVRQEEIAALRASAEASGTVWSRFNLAEILPEPTPMTWSIVRRFMSGKGGFGQMYRDLGFDPDPALDDAGMFDLICGRPYCNLSHEPRMQYRSLPFEHNFGMLKKNPDKAIYPQASFNPRRAGIGFLLKLPWLFLKMWWSQIKQKQAMRTFAEDFLGVIVPRYLGATEKFEAEDFTKLSNKKVLARLEALIELTLFDFARHSLKPTALAALMLADLERAFAGRLKPVNVKPAEALALGQQKAQAALRELMMGVHPDEQTDLAAGIRALQTRRLSRDEFLCRFGHRGSLEMELSRPRWSEEPSTIERLQMAEGRLQNEGQSGDEAWRIAWLKLADEARLLPHQRPAVEAELRRLQTYMGLRETAKHYLLRGYAQIRRALLELDRRFEMRGAIFFLTWTDLPGLVADGACKPETLDQIEKARRRREIALSLPVPRVIFSDDLDAIGRESAVASGGVMQGVPLSAGVVEAPAWVLHDAAGAVMPLEPYILVCPSTDPAWVPLFVQARGLVMETGGVLSHGAIVAREFGLPAVAGIADVHRRVKTGQRLRIDGSTGAVSILD